MSSNEWQPKEPVPCPTYRLLQPNPNEASAGCFKINDNCGIQEHAGINGYFLPASSTGCIATPATNGSSILTTGMRATVLLLLLLLFIMLCVHLVPPLPAFVNYGKYTVVVVASWCSALANVTLDIDFGAIGLDPAKTVLLTPFIDSLQDGLPPRPWNTTFPVPDHGGLIGVLTANATFLQKA